MSCAKKIFAIAALLSLGACGGPKIIPDRELARIFRDVYLTDSYISQKGTDVDSLNIYEPIFASYGYTSEDIQYTIGSFAKRKSARLSDDVVEVAAEMLRGEARLYRRRMELRDTAILVAKEKFAEAVYFDSLVTVRRAADTSRLRIVIDGVRPGSYKVSYGYLIDSLDRNTPLRSDAWLERGDGTRTGTGMRRLERWRRATVETTLDADSTRRRLVLLLAEYPKGLSTPRFTVDSLRVTYYPPDGIALRRLMHSWYGGGRSILDSLPGSLLESHETYLVAPLVDTARPRIR